jgi:integrase
MLKAGELSINQMLLAYWKFAQLHYRHPDGQPTHEQADILLSLRPLRQAYGEMPARSFGPLALKAVREKMIRDGLCRGVINQRINRIRRAFKWAVSEELVGADVLTGLQAVTGLKAGRTNARETEPVKPVPSANVDAVLPFLLPPVRAMVRLQRLTGMRPGEVIQMTASQLDMSGPIWLYKPIWHKNAYRDRERAIALGPRAQAIVKEFLTLNVDAPLFSARAAIEQQKVDRRARRKTPLFPSHLREISRKRKRHPRRQASEFYSVPSYERAIARACDRAWPAPEPLCRRDGESAEQHLSRLSDEQREELRRWRAEHRWSPNQLRHLHATEVRRQFGIEAAQTALGHASIDTTKLYAERNLALAAKVAAAVG